MALISGSRRQLRFHGLTCSGINRNLSMDWLDLSRTAGQSSGVSEKSDDDQRLRGISSTQAA